MTRRRRAAVVAAAALVLVAAAGGVVKVRHDRAATDRTARACALVHATTARAAAEQSGRPSGAGDLIAFLGDSYTQGMYLPDPLQAFPYVAAQDRGDRALVDGVGGSGYISQGPCLDGALLNRVDAVTADRPAVVVVQAGINDRLRPAAEVTSAAIAVLEAVKVRAPQARVLVVGPFAPPAARGAALDRTAEAVRAAAGSAGATFVDPRAWTFTTLPDQLHPDAAGHRLIGDRLAAVLPVG
jgi:lysophospholipase L1-like esterase